MGLVAYYNTAGYSDALVSDNSRS